MRGSWTWLQLIPAPVNAKNKDPIYMVKIATVVFTAEFCFHPAETSKNV